MSKQIEFIRSIKDAAIKACKGDSLFPSIVIAQACLESNYGLSGLSLNCNNFFGIKAGTSWKKRGLPFRSYPTTEYINSQPRKVSADFAKFKDFQECLEEHNAMLHRVPNYTHAKLFQCSTPEGQANSLRLAGYATDPGYPKKLITIINEYGLRQFDNFADGSSVAFWKGEDNA